MQQRKRVSRDSYRVTLVPRVREDGEISTMRFVLGYRTVISCADVLTIIMPQKLGIRDYAKESGIGYTFVDVGFWSVLLHTVPLRSISK